MNGYSPDANSPDGEDVDSSNSKTQGRVNGVVQQLNGAERAGASTPNINSTSSSSSEPQSTGYHDGSGSVNGAPRSVADTTSSEDLENRKSPMKLKRKVPG